MSDDGRHVAFRSFASNLVPVDTNGTWDVFLRDTVAGTTQRVSMATGGTQANQESDLASVSRNGRYVAFYSNATNLVPGDTGWQDVFVRDTVTGTTRRVSVTAAGAQANGPSYGGAVSDDGQRVAFDSYASNLAPGDSNAKIDVFVRDTAAGTTTRVSEATGGTQGNSDSYQPDMSGDGRYVVFYSQASNLVAGDTNSALDVFVRDTTTGVTSRASVASDGSQANGRSDYPAISGGGRYVAFTSQASNLVAGDTNAKTDAFVRDVVAGVTARVSVATDGTQADDDSYEPSVSTDGAHVAFASSATNLVVGDTNATEDVFVHDTGAAENLVPTAAFSAAPNPLQNLGVLLDASGSDDVDGTITDYHWDFGDTTTTGGPDPAVVHVYPAPGVYAVTLTVTVTDDDGATATTTAQVEAADTRPVTRALAVDAAVGAATVRADVRLLSFFGLFDFYLGTARVSDPAADVVTWGLVLAPVSGVVPAGLNGARFTAFSLDTRSLPWRTGRLDITLDDRDLLAGAGPDTVAVTGGAGAFASYNLTGAVTPGDVAVTR